MPESLSEFFLRVTGNGILPYQERYGADPFLSTLLIIPTGLGKTDAALVPWLFAQYQRRPQTPNRLVIVLPRQNLTRQTAEVARKRIEAAGLSERVRVLELMGGSDDNAMTLAPDEQAIIVCTQDLYLSRALNRGYARRPARWPIDFALLNNDCLLVFDEVQLMSDGLATSTQLAAMRDVLGVFGQVPCLWMSATVDPAWPDTIDFRTKRTGLRVIQLEADDLRHSIVQQRYLAHKRIHRAPAECRTPQGCAGFAIANHQSGERTLIIANTVARAREVYAEIRRSFPDTLLLHSRFRPEERNRHLEAVLRSISAAGEIIVATQVLEAGIDISVHRLITDLASWGSVVQRMGRANRYGELDQGADIWWVDEPRHSKTKSGDDDKLFAPYEAGGAKIARDKLTALTSAAPADLPAEDGPAPWHYVLRRSDVLDLFDTSPDLSGNEIDISRFIRSGEERDVYLAWRNWIGDKPGDDMPELDDRELCPAPIGEVREFARKHPLYRWNFSAETWERADREKLVPGMTLLARVNEGGYTAAEGWSPDSKAPVIPVELVAVCTPESDTSDQLSFIGYSQSLRDHTNAVVSAITEMIDRLQHTDSEVFRADLDRAAKLHDWGKAHPVMQETLRGGEAPGELLAKSAGSRKHKRKHFRHELASALAMISTGESDLAAYLAAAHHGRVRVSIRSMSGESDNTARGIHEGDLLPSCEVSTGTLVPEITLSLEVMKLGTGKDGRMSWTDRALRLRERLGPFRLAYLEMLLRAADERASARDAEMAACPTN